MIDAKSMKKPMDEMIVSIRKLIDANSLKNANQLATRLTSEYSSEPRAWRERAFVKTMQGRHTASISDMTKAIALNAMRSLDYIFTRAISWFRLGNYKNAVDDFTQTIALGEFFKMDSHRVQAHLFRADCFVRLKKFTEAQADCLHLPDDFSTWTDSLRSKKDILKDCLESLKPKRRRKSGPDK